MNSQLRNLLALIISSSLLFSCTDDKNQDKGNTKTESDSSDHYSQLAQLIQKNDLDEFSNLLEKKKIAFYDQGEPWDSAGLSLFHMVILYDADPMMFIKLLSSIVRGIHHYSGNIPPPPIYALDLGKPEYAFFLASINQFYPHTHGINDELVWKKYYDKKVQRIDVEKEKYFYTSLDGQSYIFGKRNDQAYSNKPLLTLQNGIIKSLSLKDVLSVKGLEAEIKLLKNDSEIEYLIYADPKLKPGKAPLFREIMKSDKDSVDRKYRFHDNQLYSISHKGEIRRYELKSDKLISIKEVSKREECKVINETKITDRPMVYGIQKNLDTLEPGTPVVIIEPGSMTFYEDPENYGSRIPTRWLLVVANQELGWVQNRYLSENSYKLNLEDSVYLIISPGQMPGRDKLLKYHYISYPRPENLHGQGYLNVSKDATYNKLMQIDESPDGNWLVFQGCYEEDGYMMFYNKPKRILYTKHSLCPQAGFAGDKFLFWEVSNEKRGEGNNIEHKVEEKIFENGEFSSTGVARWRHIHREYH